MRSVWPANQGASRFIMGHEMVEDLVNGRIVKSVRFRCYRSTDNLVDPRWLGLEPARAIDAVRGAGLGWDRRRRTGVVLHLLSCLAVDGRLGLTAIAPNSSQADALYDDVVDVLRRLEAPARRHSRCPPRTGGAVEGRVLPTFGGAAA